MPRWSGPPKPESERTPIWNTGTISWGFGDNNSHSTESPKRRRTPSVSWYRNSYCYFTRSRLPVLPTLAIGNQLKGSAQNQTPHAVFQWGLELSTGLIRRSPNSWALNYQERDQPPCPIIVFDKHLSTGIRSIFVYTIKTMSGSV